MTSKEWHEELRKKYYSWANNDQWECCRMIFNLIGGEHHLNGKIRPIGISGIEYNNAHNIATYDGSLLTNLILESHKEMIRVSIHPCNPNYLRWRLFKRHLRDGDYWEKHPTIETAINMYYGKS